MADRNPNDLNREQRGSMTPSPTERVEDRNTRSREDELSNPNRSNTPNRDSAVGDESRERDQNRE